MPVPEELHLVARRGAGELEGDVLCLDAGNAHVLVHLVPRDHDRFHLAEAEKAEEPLRGFDVSHDDRDVIEALDHRSSLSSIASTPAWRSPRRAPTACVAAV